MIFRYFLSLHTGTYHTGRQSETAGIIIALSHLTCKPVLGSAVGTPIYVNQDAAQRNIVHVPD